MLTQAVNTNFTIAGIIFAHCINAPTTAVDSVPSHDMKLSRYLPTRHHKAVEQNTNNGSYLASIHRMTHFLSKLSSAGIIFAQRINVPTQAVSINLAIAGSIFAHCSNAPTTAVDSEIKIAATVCTEPVLSWDERHLFFRSYLHRVQVHTVFVLAQLLHAFCKCHVTVLQEIVRCVPLSSQTRNRTDLHDFALNRPTECIVQLC